jgi:2-dehydro-3-deoxyphosphogluconate aldolase/(4S)-4-hydroxy-2-oxoglutarate aldolase
MGDIDVLDLLCGAGVLPVLAIEDLDSVRKVGTALCAGGLAVAEVTLRTRSAAAAIRALVDAGEMLVGAGTVLRHEQVDLAREAGARFVVTPGFSAAVVERCRERGVPVIPGVSSATEIIAALDHGSELLKFFPAEASGGVAMLQAWRAPFPNVRFVPTGGVSSANAAAYLDLPSVAAVGGSWMVTPELVGSGDFGAISRLAEQAVQLVAEARA